MATQKINGLQVSQTQNWSGLTFDTHLYNIQQNEVQMSSELMTEIFNKMGFYGLETFMAKYPLQVLDHDGDYSWRLKGDDRRAISIVGYTAPDTARPGIGRQSFELELAEKNFNRSDVLIFDDRAFKVRVVDDGRSNGTTWIYTVEHMKPSLTYFIPAGLLAAGFRVSRESNAVTNVLNDEFTTPEYSSHFEMRNGFSTLSMKREVVGNMHDRAILIKMKGPNGEMVNTWTRYDELKTDFQWMQSKNNQLFYGESNRDENGRAYNIAGNGHVIKISSGLREQISPSYQFRFNKLSLDFLFEVGLNLSLNIRPEDDREFVILTGERGMIAFHKLIEDKVAIFQPLGDGRTFGSGQNRGFGGQYRSYMGPQGIKYTVMHMPEYDNPIDNRLPHPDGGYTENYRMTIMNIGTTDGQPNIQRIVPKNRFDLKGYMGGLMNPMGPNKGGMMSQAKDGYSVHYQTTQSIKLVNPFSVAELIPSVSTQY